MSVSLHVDKETQPKNKANLIPNPQATTKTRKNKITLANIFRDTEGDP